MTFNARSWSPPAAAEVGALPEGAMIAWMLNDYAVLRDQALACREIKRRA
ncbi:MAG: hypothetical protein ACNA7M_11325 [Roseovarius sp.]